MAWLPFFSRLRVWESSREYIHVYGPCKENCPFWFRPKTRAKGTGYSWKKIKTSILKLSKLRMGTQNASQIWPKSAQNRLLCTKLWTSVDISFFVKFWNKFDRWNCEGKRFPPSLKSYGWVSQKSKLPVTSCTRFLGCIFVTFSFFKFSEKVRPRESQGLSNAALKNGC